MDEFAERYTQVSATAIKNLEGKGYMKYYATGKQTIYPEDYKTKVEFLRRSQDWLKEKIEEGIVESAYSFTAGGGFIIFNVESHNDLVKYLIDFPLYCLCEFTVQPLVTFQDNADLIIDEFKKCGMYCEEKTLQEVWAMS